MTIGVVQHAVQAQGAGGPWSSADITFSPATAGNLLVVIGSTSHGVLGEHFHAPTGYTLRTAHPDVASTTDVTFMLATKVAAGGETSVSVPTYYTSEAPGSVNRTTLVFLEINGIYDSFVENNIGNGGHSYTLPAIIPPSGVEALLLAAAVEGPGAAVNVGPSTMTFIESAWTGTVVGSGETIRDWYRHIPMTSGSYSDVVSYTTDLERWWGVQVVVTELADPTPVASFIPVSTTITEGDTVHFTDTSDPKSGTITAWAWTFGDGGTSTSQNPSHQYAGHGTFTVTLTITIASTPYVATGTVHSQADVGYTPPLPGLALVEIYATAPGSARWDFANWDEAVWSSDKWQNVTPVATDINIIWGSQRPELGILSTPDAASWGVGFYDPQRLLDPANADSPYFGDIVPGLPVRVTHKGWVVKQGVLESAGHNFDLNDFKSHNAGYFRVTDSQSLMARSKVPSDTTLGDDLFTRAEDAIAAAGLSIRVVRHIESPLGLGHDLVPWVTGTDQSVWQWISDAAAQVLHVPFINRTGELEFREWSNPRDFAKEIASPNLVGLGSVIFVNGTYSVVTVLDDDGVTLVTRELTPKPYYGAVTYDDRATKPTPNAGAWAQAVLDDRSVAGLRWVPGEVFPLTANDVRYFAEIEAVERVSIDYVEANPPISATGIVVGGQIVITPVQEREAHWSFVFQVAATTDQPLVDDDDAASYLVNDDDPGDYLYPG